MKFLTRVGIVALFFSFVGCDRLGSAGTPVSRTGVGAAKAEVKAGSDGLTVEQRNIKKRIEAENVPGSVKHLYIVSSMSGDCILYSTVQGKVTSSGKRLTPYSVATDDGEFVTDEFGGFSVDISGNRYRTGEVLQDDGTYGSSIEYLYWWDTRGMYHQQYVTGGVVIHISDSPMAWPKIIVNLEETHD